MALPRRLLLLALVSLGVAGCTHAPPPPGHSDVLIGRVRAPESFQVPPGAVLYVRLLDIDAPDVPDFIVAEQERAVRELPATLEVHYDPHGLAPQSRYGLAAELRLGDTLLADCEPVPVATQGHPTSAELVLVPATR